MKTLRINMRIASLLMLALFMSSALFAASEVKKEDRSLASFSAIKLNCSADLYITQGGQQSVKVVADAKIIEFLTTEVEEDVLIIDVKKHRNNWNIDKLEVYITVPTLTKITSNGSGDIYGKDTFNAKNMVVSLKGSGDFDFNFDVQNLQLGVYGSGDADVSGIGGDFQLTVSGSGDIEAENMRLDNCTVKINGSGDVQLEGKTNKLSIGINGSGDLDASEFMAVEVVAKNSGSGDVMVHAIEKLDVQINGSGDIKYYGDPENVHVDARGSGEVYKR